MIRQLVIVLLAAIVLSACGSKQESHSGHEMNMGMSESDMIQVDLVLPAEVKIKEEATFTAHVMKDGKPVTDAEKVEFEWWLGEGEHQKQVVSHSANGNYVFKQTFDQPGTYTIISHVQVADMHSMPKKSFEVKE